VIRLLQSAGSALKALTNKPLPKPDSDSPSTAPLQDRVSLKTQQTAFTNSVAQYFSLLSSIDVRLRRQVYALEEADIIAPEPSSKDVQTSFASTASGTSSGGKSSIYGGQSALDVGSLNSRRDSVGKDMEAELWKEARELLEKFEGRDRGVGVKQDPDDSMEVDSSPT
jgi:hypothetical protein